MERQVLAAPSGPIAARVWRRPGAPWLHFAHATGMHGGIYLPLLGRLADRFSIVASDARGHGRTAAAGNRTPVMDWGEMADDLLAVIDAVAPGQSWVLAGHSLGGVVSALAAARAPGRVRALVMADPAIMKFAVARAGGPDSNLMAERAAQRRPDFPSRAAARAAWAGRGVFADWPDAALDAHVADALLDGEPAALACTPAYEAMTFEAWPRGLEADLARLAVPFTLLAAAHESTVGLHEFAWLAAHPFCRRADRLAGSGHFLPLSHGEDVAAAILAALTPGYGAGCNLTGAGSGTADMETQ